MKINVDGAICPSGYSVACVCRDLRVAILGGSMSHDVSVDPVMGAARGVVLGLQIAVDLGSFFGYC